MIKFIKKLIFGENTESEENSSSYGAPLIRKIIKCDYCHFPINVFIEEGRLNYDCKDLAKYMKLIDNLAFVCIACRKSKCELSEYKSNQWDN